MQLNRSIAFTASWKYTLLITLILGALISFIMIFLQPFDTYQHNAPNKNLLLSGYSLCIAIPILLLHIPELVWFKNQNSRWYLFNELILIFLGTAFMTILAFVYNTKMVNEYTISWGYLWDWLLTFGLPFVPFVIPIWAYLRFRFSDVTISLVTANTSSITITGENVNEQLQFAQEQFIFAKAQSNYVDVYLLNEKQQAEKHVLRSTLSGLVNQLSFAEQVHRSYLVNPEHILSLEGNTRKGAALLNHIEEPVPVSPKHFKGLKTYLQNRP
ncbi:LytTR family transcriptional regulator [Robertkochia marina]|uniref:LytTR family transcriptional regulator n=1 Tax=Robertkochia marina TaxID=1227945 RepID=A0A4S3M4Y7_9FLAO|nr:LytTR family DNA-binding domain-containing protein [Robertkochia marina]THD69277.1 LytTR family transcriptional regulator [Robertkochia marina]TRZ47464.1 LytTR family transcriptional regulator [Robertkochia marina]